MFNNSDEKKHDISLEGNIREDDGQAGRYGNSRPNLHPSKEKDSLTFKKKPFSFIAERMIFNFKKSKSKRYDMIKVIYKGLAFLMIEFILYLIFQLISYLVLEEEWKDASFVPGVVLGVIWLALMILILVLMNRRRKNMTLILIVKFFEFLAYMLLTGYLTAIDFGFMSLSYIIILNIILIFIFVF